MTDGTIAYVDRAAGATLGYTVVVTWPGQVRQSAIHGLSSVCVREGQVVYAGDRIGWMFAGHDLRVEESMGHRWRDSKLREPAAPWLRLAPWDKSRIGMRVRDRLATQYKRLTGVI